MTAINPNSQPFNWTEIAATTAFGAFTGVCVGLILGIVLGCTYSDNMGNHAMVGCIAGGAGIAFSLGCLYQVIQQQKKQKMEDQSANFTGYEDEKQSGL